MDGEIVELNHHNDPEGLLIALDSTSHPNYLGDITVIDNILRGMVACVVIRIGEVGDKKITPMEASAADRQGCIDAANCIAGNNQKFSLVEGWTGEPLAQFVRDRTGLGHNEAPEVVIAHALAEMVLSIYQKVSAGLAEEAIAEQINHEINSMCLLMLGVASNE